MNREEEGQNLSFIDQTYGSAAENVAAEQLLLEYAEAFDSQGEILRIWSPEQTMVVLGRGGKVNDDVFLDRCRQDNIPVIRRISGGGTILAGCGCLMYTLIFSLARRPEMRSINYCHQFVGNRFQKIYRRCGYEIQLRGHSDLCMDEKKFSGNALRIGRSHLIYHGTLLVDFDLELIPRYLKLPPRRPEYRRSRGHLEFVTNLLVDKRSLTDAIQSEFGAIERKIILDEEALSRLLIGRYENDAWNLKL